MEVALHLVNKYLNYVKIGIEFELTILYLKLLNTTLILNNLIKKIYKHS